MMPEEHATRAMLLGKSFDLYTKSYRDRSPEGSKYNYDGSLDADTLEPLIKGEVARRERLFGVGNTVSNVRLGTK